MQFFVGIDVSLEMSSICIIDERGVIIKEGKTASVPLASEDSQIGVRMRVCLYGQDRTHPGSS